MLNIPSKLTESVARISHDKHLEDTIHQNQWAYKKGHSTESLLLYLTEDWKHSLNQGKIIGLILIDFRKAFDSMGNKILFENMRNIGMSDDLLAWLQNYSYGRKQFVEINNKRSSMRNIRSATRIFIWFKIILHLRQRPINISFIGRSSHVCRRYHCFCSW